MQLSATFSIAADGLTEEQSFVVFAAALLEQLLDEENGKAAAARLLRNATAGFAIQVAHTSRTSQNPLRVSQWSIVALVAFCEGCTSIPYVVHRLHSLSSQRAFVTSTRTAQLPVSITGPMAYKAKHSKLFSDTDSAQIALRCAQETMFVC